MEELEIIINNVNIKYKIKKRKYDTQHLIVVFSGFGLANLYTYDFENALSECPATVAWIKDEFHGCCSYYLCRENDYSIEYSVYKFIEHILDELLLSKEQCTLIGFSKGGSASLYFGVKYGFKNIVSTVPQLKIGTYTSNSWPQVANHMMGLVDEKSINRLDCILPEVLGKDSILDRNIYLLTSFADEQYEEHIERYLHLFMKYNNFNLFYAQSLLVREHNQVTSYHVPLILSICYAISQGAIPKYGCSFLSGDKRLGDSKVGEAIAILKKVPLKERVIYPEGISVIKGISCSEYKDINHILLFKNNKETYTFPLAKSHRPILTRQLYENGYVNYDKGWFCTPSYKGIDISSLPQGKFDMFIQIECQKIKKVTRLKVDVQNINKNIISNNFFHILSEGDGVVICVK